MKRTTTTFRVIAGVIIVAVIAILTNHFAGILADRTENYLKDKRVESSPVAPEEDVPNEVLKEVIGEVAEESLEPAKRIVHVPDTRRSTSLKEYEESRYLEINGENLARITTSALDKALDGDMRAAIGLPRLRAVCRDNFTDEAWVEEEVEKTMKRVRNGSIPLGEIPLGEIIGFTGLQGLGFTVYSTEAENRTHLMQWFRACKHVRAIWTSETRKQLEGLAREGHVMARYIYATWVPRGKLNSESFSQFTEYQTNALEFSLANLEEGETAGLVAFGRSYWGGHFTTPFFDLGTAFLKAALDCGLQSEIIEELVYRKANPDSDEYSELYVFPGGDPKAVLAQAEKFSEICR